MCYRPAGLRRKVSPAGLLLITRHGQSPLDLTTAEDFRKRFQSQLGLERLSPVSREKSALGVATDSGGTLTTHSAIFSTVSVTGARHRVPEGTTSPQIGRGTKSSERRSSDRKRTPPPTTVPRHPSLFLHHSVASVKPAGQPVEQPWEEIS